MTPPQLQIAGELFEIPALQVRVELEHALHAAEHIHIGLHSPLHGLRVGTGFLLEAHSPHLRSHAFLMSPQRETANQADEGDRKARHPETERGTREGRLKHQGIRKPEKRMSGS
ncbi:hypothetical protein SDC9_108229 [bioreactor metagenome]|uniref:Uncharacterized protein n=1 Tax=bioreactor metagenome TaxID=1076179 RepID=A0A645B9Q0_9ZZZZ